MTSPAARVVPWASVIVNWSIPSQGTSVFRPAGSRCKPSLAVWSVVVAEGPQATPTEESTVVWTLNASVVAEARPLRGDLERVSDPGLIERQVGEVGHAGLGGHRQRAAQRGCAGVVRQGHGDRPVELGVHVALAILRGDGQAEIGPTVMLPGGWPSRPVAGRSHRWRRSSPSPVRSPETWQRVAVPG